MQGENDRQWKKNEREHVQYSLHAGPAPGVTKTFLEVSRCSRAKQRQRNVQKQCAAREKLLFAN